MKLLLIKSSLLVIGKAILHSDFRHAKKVFIVVQLNNIYISLGWNEISHKKQSPQI